jgi:hypothetical protein
LRRISFFLASKMSRKRLRSFFLSPVPSMNSVPAPEEVGAEMAR